MAILTIDIIQEKVSPIAKKYQFSKVYLFGSYVRRKEVDLVPVIQLTEAKSPIRKYMFEKGVQKEKRLIAREVMWNERMLFHT